MSSKKCARSRRGGGLTCSPSQMPHESNGRTAFYFCIPKYYRKLGCEIPNEPLGTNYEGACGEDGTGGRAATLNALFDEWNDQRKGESIEQAKIARYGTIDWLFRRYKTEKAYTEKVSPRSRSDYEHIMQMICDTVGKSGRRIGERQIEEVTPRAADKIYEKIINGPNGIRLRQGEKVVGRPQGLAHNAQAASGAVPQKNTRTRGTTSHSRAVRRVKNTQRRARRPMNSRGAALRKAGPSRQQWR
jgi:hypothetical protein